MPQPEGDGRLVLAGDRAPEGCLRREQVIGVDELPDIAARQFIFAVAEQAFVGGVVASHGAIELNHAHQVDCGIEQCFETAFAFEERVLCGARGKEPAFCPKQGRLQARQVEVAG